MHACMHAYVHACLYLEVGEVDREVELLDNACIFARGRARLLLTLCARHNLADATVAATHVAQTPRRQRMAERAEGGAGRMA